MEFIRFSMFIPVLITSYLYVMILKIETKVAKIKSKTLTCLSILFYFLVHLFILIVLWGAYLLPIMVGVAYFLLQFIMTLAHISFMGAEL